MLSRKTLGVAGAAILGSAALLTANTANAVINLTPATGEIAGKVMIARETLLMGTAYTTTVGGVTYYNIVNDSSILDIQVDRGVRSDAAVYYRIELENMVFAGANQAVLSGEGSAAVTAVTGGMATDNYIVFSAAGGEAATNNLTVAATALAVLPHAAGSIKMEVFRDSFDALGPTNAVGSLTKMMSGAIEVVDGISERSNSSMSVAEVATEFMQFTGDTGTAHIGRLRIGHKTGVTHQLGTAVAGLGDMLNGTLPIEVTFKGDFSVGTPSLNSGISATDKCDAGNNVPSTVGDDGEMMKAKLTPDTQPDGAANVDWYLCLAVDEDNEMPLPTGAFTATVKYAAIENGMGRAEQTVKIGSIGRNGASAYIPYLTTDDRYNQRIIIVNRGVEANYIITFSSEDGIMTEAGMDAMGTLAANSTTVMKTSNVVMITGGPPHRASGMLSVVGGASDISVATNQTNRMDGSTDTVVYEVMGM